MMSEDEMDNEPEEVEDTPVRSEGSGSRILRYRIPIIIVIAFIAGVLLTNTINSSITGAIISDLESEKQTIQSTGTIQKTSLELEVKNLQNEIEKLESGLGFYKGIVDSLEAERFQTITAPLRNRIEFQVNWDKYIIARPGEEYVWDISIENLDDTTRTFSTSLKIKSNKDELFSRVPATGSLTLTPENSGNLEVKLVPEGKGYAILEMYINTHYIGDLVIFSV
jgi:hypothetical protein